MPTSPAAARAAARVASTSSIASWAITTCSSRRGTMSRPGRLVAAAREREPEVERPHVAHEGAVLVPGAADRRVRLAQRRLVHREQRRLAEVVPDEPRQAGRLEQLEHLVREHRRVRREHAAAVADPRPHRRDLEARLGLELLVVAGGRAPAGGERARARRRRGRSARRSASASSRSTSPRTSRQPSRRIAGAQQRRRQVRRGDLGQRIALGQARRSRARRAAARRPARAVRTPARWRSRSSRRSVSRSRRARLAAVRRAISARRASSVCGRSAAGPRRRCRRLPCA